MKIMKELQSDVVSVNNILREKVKEMDCIELLRNCHPSSRSRFAFDLYKGGHITEAEAKEFTITVGTKR